MFYVIWSLIVILSLAADLLSKYFVVQNIALDMGSVTVIPGVLEFIYTQNPGIAFGTEVPKELRPLWLIFSICAIIAVLVYLFWKKPKSKLLCTSLALIASGGIGNIIFGHLFVGYVVDFINFIAFPKLWHYPFNIADSCIVVGSFILIIYMCIDTAREMKLEKQKKLEAANGGSAAEAEAEAESETEADTDNNDTNE